jgi:mannose-6-phosphate isomerase-like protein (cupin superfamily)
MEGDIMKVFSMAEVEGTLEYGGIVRQALKAGQGAEMSCGTLVLKPGEVMKDFESHGSDEIFFIAAGELKIARKQGEDVFVGQGQIVHLPKGEWHWSSNPGKTDTLLFWVNRD